MFKDTFKPGLKATFKKTPTIPLQNLYGGLDYLLSTPQVMEVIITSSSEMLDPLLEDGYLTVGLHMEIDHLQPTLSQGGGPLTVRLVVNSVQGNTVLLGFECEDNVGLICRGNYKRAVVNKTKLRDATYKRLENF